MRKDILAEENLYKNRLCGISDIPMRGITVDHIEVIEDALKKRPGRG
jgi:hypothetical protein